MNKCPYCKKDMTILQDETAIPHSWGSYTLYGCNDCHGVFFKRSGSPYPNKKDSKGNKMRPKPIYDPYHHHDSHLIN